MNSFSVFTGTDKCTTMMFGMFATSAIGAKSFCGSKASFLYRLGLIAIVGEVSVMV
jgi:hypothetical protein